MASEHEPEPSNMAKRVAVTFKILPAIHDRMKKKVAEIPMTLSMAIEDACEAWLAENEHNLGTGHSRSEWVKVWKSESQKPDKSN